MKKLKIIFVSIVIIMLLASNFSTYAYFYTTTENQLTEEKIENEIGNEVKDETQKEEIVDNDKNESSEEGTEQEPAEENTTENATEENVVENDTNTTNEITKTEVDKNQNMVLNENNGVIQEIQILDEVPEITVDEQAITGEQTIADGVYEIELALNSNKVIEVADASQYSGGNVQVFQRNNAKCQKVNIEYVGNGYYTVQFLHSGMYLDVADGNTADGTNVWQCRYNGSDAQQWIIQDLGNGYYSFVSKCSNTYLTVANGQTGNCTNIEINSKKDDLSQTFKLNKKEIITGKQTIEDGVYEIELALDSNKVVEVLDASQNSGGNVQVFQRNNAACQKVNIKYIENGYYTVQFLHSGMYLDVADGNTADGTNVWQCRYNGSDAQQWIIQDLGNGYYSFVSKCSNTYLTVANGQTGNCTNIEINSKKDDLSQAFKLNKKEIITGEQTITDGMYEIELALDSNKVVEVLDASQNSGGNVQVFQRNNATCQRVNIEYVGDGYYTIEFEHSGMYLDVADGNTADGTNVWQCRYNGSDAQLWIIQDLGNGYYSFVSKCSNTYLTVANGQTSNCTNIEINSKKGDLSQAFKLNKKETITGERTIEDGKYEIELALNSNKVVEVADASQASGGNVQIFQRNNAKCQKVNIQYVGDGYYTIEFEHSGMYLDVADGNTADGTNVWQCRYNGSNAQQWIIQDLGNGYYSFISKCSNTYLTVAGGKTGNCTNIEINSKKVDLSQSFKLNKIENVVGKQTIANGKYEIELALDSNKVIEVLDASQYAGGNVQIYQRNNAKCQRVNIQYVGDGYYTIQFEHSGMYLDVANGETTNGTNVWQYTYNGSDNQQWIIQDLGEGYYNIISKSSNTYLTVANGQTKNCTNIEINSKKDDQSQTFKLIKQENVKGEQTIEDGKYEIELALDSNKVVEVLDASMYSGANVQVFQRNNANCQRVNIKYVGDGYYTIQFDHSGLYLDVSNGDTTNGTNVWQCTYNGADAQKWVIQDLGDGYYSFISKCSNTYLTVAGGQTSNCTNIEINSKKDDKSQEFKLNKIEVLTGIDVSEHQKIIDWDAVKKSGIAFAIIRCGYGKDDPSQDDKMFARNVAECERLNIPYGIYLYSYALDIEGAKSEAAHALRLISGHNPELGIWFDMEDADGYKLRNGMPSNNTLVEMCITFCEIMKDNGYKTGVYANLNWLMNQLNDSRLDIYDKWVAQWNSTCDYTKKYIMWQYTSDGTVEGIEGRVDMNKYYL